MESIQNKRERLVEAALEVFCEAGFEAASMERIAARAGVAKGTVYLYYESKDHLFEEIYQLCAAERSAACAAHTKQVTSVLDRLCMRLHNGMRWELAAPEKNRLVRIYLAHPRFGGKANMIGQCTESVQGLMDEGVAAGELRPLPAPLLEQMYIHFGSAMYYYVTAHPEAAEDEALWQGIAASLRGCLGADCRQTPDQK